MKFNKIVINSIGAAILLLAAVFAIQARPGDLDKTFGTNGIAANGISGLNPVYPGAFALQTDGKIIVVGTGQNGNNGSAAFVARYNTDGSPDAAFGTGGIVITRFPQGDGVDTSSFNAVVVQPDGKIVVGGLTTTNTVSFYYSDAVFARFNANGSLDTTFGTGGRVYTHTGATGNGDGNATIYSLQIAPDGSIYGIGGNGSRDTSGVSVRPAAILKISSNGASLAAVYPNYGGNDIFRRTFSASALQPDGKLVVGLIGGGYGGAVVINDFVLMRFNPDLSLDSTFGTNGIAVTDFGTGTEQANGIVLDPDGKITVSGGNATASDSGNFYAARYNPNGSLDATFGTGGKVTVLISDAPVNADKEAQRLVRQPDGKYISAFGARYGEIGAIRLLPNGALDPSFGYGGIAHYQSNNGSYPYPNIDGQGGNILLQPDGKIILPATDGNAVVGFNGIKLLRLTNYVRNDFDGDGRGDISVYRTGIWYVSRSSDSGVATSQWGIATDKIVPADYDGDGKTDYAVFRDGFWYILTSQGTFQGAQWGNTGDLAAPFDFDGDGKADLSVFRNGTWYVLKSSGGVTTTQWGSAGDIPVVADYDGDGKADYGVYRNGIWYILRSNLGATAIQWGIAGDKTVPADYDGDGKADFAVFRNGFWYVLTSQGTFQGAQWGASGDIAAPADYDGDGKTDLAVFRNGVWYLQRTTAGVQVVNFGIAGDKPIPNAFVP